MAVGQLVPSSSSRSSSSTHSDVRNQDRWDGVSFASSPASVCAVSLGHGFPFFVALFVFTSYAVLLSSQKYITREGRATVPSHVCQGLGA
jgi:hypothetical protein